MSSFDGLSLVAPIVNLLTETGNFLLNLVSLLLRLLGIEVAFF